MTGLLLAQLAWVFEREAEAIRQDYSWPPKRLSPAENAECAYLEYVAGRLFTRAVNAGQASGTDYCFGGMTAAEEAS